MSYKGNGFVVVSVTPHTSHRLQSLDVTFYDPLKAVFQSEIDLFIKTKGLGKNTLCLAGIFNKAYSQLSIIAKGVWLQITSIYPLNSSVFSEECSHEYFAIR
jgi:hypothetical protein